MECLHEEKICEDGEHVCIECGTIFGSVIEEGAEWRNYANTEGDTSRTGTFTNELLPNSSFGSVVRRGRNNPSAEAATISKLSVWAMSGNSDRSWMNIFDAIQTAAFRANLPRAIVVDACSIFKEVEESQKTRGDTRRALMAACIFVTCRHQNASRSHEEIAQLFQVNIRSLCKALMKVDGDASNSLQTQLGIAERICADMNVSEDQRTKILSLLAGLPEMEHTPKTVVAAIVAQTIGDVPATSKASGVSVVSIRKLLKKWEV